MSKDENKSPFETDSSVYDPSKVEAFIAESERVIEEVLQKLDETKENLKQLGITEEFLAKNKNLSYTEEDKKKALELLDSWGFTQFFNELPGQTQDLETFVNESLATKVVEKQPEKSPEDQVRIQKMAKRNAQRFKMI
jgi:hypothetical protein